MQWLEFWFWIEKCCSCLIAKQLSSTSFSCWKDWNRRESAYFLDARSGKLCLLGSVYVRHFLLELALLLLRVESIVDFGDQVMALKQRGIKAEFLGSAQTDVSVQTRAENGHFNILFMTPEKACLIPNRYNLLRILKSAIMLA